MLSLLTNLNFWCVISLIRYWIKRILKRGSIITDNWSIHSSGLYNIEWLWKKMTQIDRIKYIIKLWIDLKTIKVYRRSDFLILYIGALKVMASSNDTTIKTDWIDYSFFQCRLIWIGWSCQSVFGAFHLIQASLGLNHLISSLYLIKLKLNVFGSRWSIVCTHCLVFNSRKGIHFINIVPVLLTVLLYNL